MGGFADDEIPRPLTPFYLQDYILAWRARARHVLALTGGFCHREIRPGQLLVGSLAGAAHLLNDNTGVLRGAQ